MTGALHLERAGRTSACHREPSSSVASAISFCSLACPQPCPHPSILCCVLSPRIFKIPANGGFANTMFHHTFNDPGHICMKASVLPQPTNSHKYNSDKTDDTTQINLRVVLDDIIDPATPFDPPFRLSLSLSFSLAHSLFLSPSHLIVYLHECRRFDIPIRNNRTKPILSIDDAKIKLTCPPIPEGLGPEGLAMLGRKPETLPFPPLVNNARDYDGYFDKASALLQSPGDVGDVGEECEDEFVDPKDPNTVLCGCRKWAPFIGLKDIKLHRPHFVLQGDVASLSLEARFVKDAFLRKCTDVNDDLKCAKFKKIDGLSLKRFGFRIDVDVEKETSNVELIVRPPKPCPLPFKFSLPRPPISFPSLTSLSPLAGVQVERATFSDAVQATVESFFDVFFDVFVPSDTAVKDHRLCRLREPPFPPHPPRSAVHCAP